MSRCLAIKTMVVTLLLFLLCGVSKSQAVSVTLLWDAVTQNTDNSTITDLAGYRLYWGTSSGVYTNNLDVGNVLTGSPSGLTGLTTYFFVVRAYDTSANESANSTPELSLITPASTPIAHWFRAETGTATTALDGSGLGHTITLNEGASDIAQQGPTWVSSPVGSAIRCDGSNDSAVTPDAADLDITGDITIAFWMRLLSTINLATDAVIITKDQPLPAHNAPWVVSLNTPGAAHLGWYHHTSGGSHDAAKSFSSYTILLDNTFRHVVITRTVSTKTLRLWISGAEILNACSGPCTYNTDLPAVSTAPVRLCANIPRDSTSYAHVDLGDVRIYNLLLNQAEIDDLQDQLRPAGVINFRVVP